MTPKLILIEGIPGFGKTTTAQLVHEILTDMNIKTQLYLEGNLDHPADYDGVACFKKKEYDELLNNHEKFRDLLNNCIINEGNHYFLEYQKMINEGATKIPNELLDVILKNDVYELTLDYNKELITERWKQFTKRALNGSDTYIFDCCFMQNPITIGMIKYGAMNEDVTSYIRELEKIVEGLKPLLIYVEQNDLEHSFRKAFKERPKEWSEGFIEYYTNQGYGKKFGYIGLEGTLQVLKARRELEKDIFNNINIAKETANNSSYDLNVYKQVLVKILTEHFGLT
ncbi:hypothetical protein EC604_25750 [Paenibacillus amylolyticus]|jgi:deoxyadenosine/deoxycytidine kinase|uniref:Group-specific protein n=1 Tax=Paenibacillus amylolyticus TaxID=1451 RepID=A0A5M9X077_PAEAM|nr:hypothetical protein [Paenibacillus amylolyticus]KAA8787241.1 hypothetical protein EC604_25750 [Paenibacillus amylolyticus]